MKVSMQNTSIGAKVFLALATVLVAVWLVNYGAYMHFAKEAAVKAATEAAHASPEASGASAAAHIRWRALSVSAASLLAGYCAIGFILYFFVRRPIGKLLAASRALVGNAGDLTTMIAIRSDDEIGRLSFALNELFSNTGSIIRMIRTTADKVNFSAQNLSAATEQMNSITEETSTTVQSIAKSTDVQARKVDEMIREIRNMERSVKQVANSAEPPKPKITAPV